MGYPIPDIIYVDVISFTDNSFDVTVECSLYDQHDSTLLKKINYFLTELRNSHVILMRADDRNVKL